MTFLRVSRNYKSQISFFFESFAYTIPYIYYSKIILYCVTQCSSKIIRNIRIACRYVTWKTDLNISETNSFIKVKCRYSIIHELAYLPSIVWLWEWVTLYNISHPTLWKLILFNRISRYFNFFIPRSSRLWYKIYLPPKLWHSKA